MSKPDHHDQVSRRIAGGADIFGTRSENFYPPGLVSAVVVSGGFAGGAGVATEASGAALGAFASAIFIESVSSVARANVASSASTAPIAFFSAGQNGWSGSAAFTMPAASSVVV